MRVFFSLAVYENINELNINIYDSNANLKYNSNNNDDQFIELLGIWQFEFKINHIQSDDN